MTEAVRYRFEPLERRGILLGLGPLRLAVLVACVLVAFALVTAGLGAAGFAAAVVVVGLGGLLCKSVGARAVLGWVGIGLSYAGRRRSAVTSPPPLRAVARSVPNSSPPVRSSAWLRLPELAFAGGVRIWELPPGADRAGCGVLVDQRAGMVASVLRARGGAFCLLDEPEQQRKLAAWGSILESLANHSGSLARLQWCQRSLPGDGDALVRHLRQAGDPASPALAGQLRLAEGAGPKSWQHETLLVVAVRWQGRLGRVDPPQADQLRNEVRALRDQLRGAGVACEPALDAQGIATAVGRYLSPGLGRYPGAYQWPLAVEEHWGEIRVDGAWHRTYWVAEWPRSDVGPDFLSPLLLGPGTRSFSVVLAPVSPEQASRDAESLRTAHLADSHLRAQGGFLETAKHRRRVEAVEGREEQLANGRGVFELAGFVSISAESLADLEQASSGLERAAGS
ncbi:MAG TPA: SCO6880 family protein, partial [Acidimicrobiales bacterium]|nr:SCO6880 family protein [Acidimicrobiales bacterium]